MTTDPILSATMIGWLTSIFSVLIFGVLVVFGFIFGNRSGGFLAALGLLVMAFGGVFAGWLAATVGLWVVQAPTVIGLVLLLAGVGMNVARHRTAQS